MAFELPPLPYDNNALEPVIDARTMEIHHDKHHNAYITNVNKAVEGTDLGSKSIEDVLRNINDVPENIRQAVINNGGGHANHSLFWQIMGPGGGGEPGGGLASAISGAFGNFGDFKGKFSTNGATRFGSGWSWLVVTGDGGLEAYSTANQDSPYMQGHTPILGLDVWEHAYYLSYQNRRPDYISAWWDAVNWAKVEENYGAAKG